MGYRKQLTSPVIRTSGDGPSGSIQGNYAVIRFNRVFGVVVQNADATVIHQRLAVAAATVLAAAFTGIQNDVPRNVVIDDNGVGAGNTGNVTVTGYDQFGEAAVEVIAINTLNAPARAEGNVAFTWITSIAFPVIGDTNIEIQQGSLIGIPADLGAGNLLMVSHAPAGANKAYYLPALFTVDTDYDTVVLTGALLAANDIFDYTILG